MTIQVSAANPHEVLSTAVVQMARLQTIIQVHDETLAAITELETYDDLGMAEKSDPRFSAELEQRRKRLSDLQLSLDGKLHTSIKQVRKQVNDLGGALVNHKELIAELAKIEGAFLILTEADELAEDGEGSREHYEALLSSLRAQVQSSTLYLVRLLRESGVPISTLVGADNGNDQQP